MLELLRARAAGQPQASCSATAQRAGAAPRPARVPGARSRRCGARSAAAAAAAGDADAAAGGGQQQPGGSAGGGGEVAARLAAAKSYRERRKAEDLEAIAAAAARPTLLKEGQSNEELTTARANAPREVEFITVDKTYRPAVTTWGVFERPADISAAFGGGRNLSPEELRAGEAPEASAARLARVRAAVGAFRKEAGLDVEVEDSAAVEAALEAGRAAMDRGRLEAAEEALRAAVDAAPLMSELGGAARLQLALCVDSLGKSDEAKALYQSLSRHPAPEVSRRAGRMLWGMTTATSFLKADRMRGLNAGMRDAYARYLQRGAATGWAPGAFAPGGEAAAEEERRLNAISAAAAAAVLLLPVGLVLALRQVAASSAASYAAHQAVVPLVS